MQSTLVRPASQPTSFPPARSNRIFELPVGLPADPDRSDKVGEPEEEGHSALQTRFAPFASKMRKFHLPLPVIRTFRHYYAQMIEGADGYLSAQQAQPLASLPSAPTDDACWQEGYAALKHTVVIKLNGGLGTSMGLQGPKSLIPVKKGLNFLDIASHQVFALRRKYKINLPLILMNSFHTDKQTQAALRGYTSAQYQRPTPFIQHRVPKIWCDDLTPATWPEDPNKEWCPPGHGDLYLALETSGMLKKLLAEGYRYAFVSNIDNLGATLDLHLLGYMAAQSLPFVLEAARRQPADRKGGHLARSAQGGLLLREVAQCPPDELAQFQDIQRYCYFNTNNLWLHLPSLQRLLDRHRGLLPLPLIRNEKPIDPALPQSPRVYQLETAMGHAVSLFSDAQAVEVKRERFLPVKTTNDLLALWSDAYVLNKDYSINLNPARQQTEPLTIDLDQKYYGMFHQLKARFPYHVPSLVNCSHFQIKGNIYFDANLVLEGNVSLQQVGDVPLQLQATAASLHEARSEGFE